MRRSYIYMAAAGALTALLSGCADENPDWNYSIPQRICGIETGESTVKPLLPKGDSLEEKIRAAVGEEQDASERCLLYVDREQHGNGRNLSIYKDREIEKIDAHQEAEHLLKFTNIQRVELGEHVTSAAIGDEGALVVMACTPKTSKGEPYKYLVTQVRFGKDADKPENLPVRHQQLKEFLRAYIPATFVDRCRN
ncbi:hypothetical protein HHL19_09325 [Streptomyces sp. R302]|uniref:hypothetical protein n=1 Tax=unclassified Streptomyces TaxID=2593676 RepID=UPI00145F5737|nr:MULTISPECIES: hypothetical protein [unclassified Streptomyces]NML53030.1 hypothetical protein [Streptomyces sp. R301]NML78865.1 hypothetical protein [Streptomyces sp. R302]